jgi:DNA-binding transcriptional LysR family regulator
MQPSGGSPVIDINAMRIFATVIEAGGVSRASETLRLPKSTVSRKLRELEAALGVPLVNRNSRGLTLTAAGGGFYERCRDITAAAAAAIEATRARDAELRGLLRLTAPVGIGQSVVQTILARFLVRHSRLQAELVLSDERLHPVRDRFDLALRMGTLEDSELRVRTLAVFERLLCASPAYLARAGMPTAPADLADHAGIVNPRERAGWTLEDGPRSIAVAVTWQLCINNVAAMRLAALEGLGIAVLPVHLVRDDLAARRLVRVLDGWSPPATEFHALFPPNGASPAAKAFADYLRDALQ